jgi:uncharacterized protein involved in exopolysaccharide biosynthesis
MANTEPDKPQPKKPLLERLVGGLDSWYKVVIATTALVVAVIGLFGAGIKA